MNDLWWTACTLQRWSPIESYDATSSVIKQSHSHLHGSEGVSCKNSQSISLITNGNWVFQDSKVLCHSSLMLEHGQIITVKSDPLGHCPSHAWEGPWLSLALIWLQVLTLRATKSTFGCDPRLNYQTDIKNWTEVIRLMCLSGKWLMFEFKLNCIRCLYWVFTLWSMNHSDLGGSTKESFGCVSIWGGSEYFFVFCVQ